MADGKRRTAVATPPGMALVRAGTFAMGENLDGESDAIPTNICVSQFYMDINLVSLSWNPFSEPIPVLLQKRKPRKRAGAKGSAKKFIRSGIQNQPVWLRE